MPLKNDGDPGLVVLETSPLLIPEPGAQPESRRWRPMNKEELELVAGGPAWRSFRSRLVLFFWLAWLCMLGAAVAVIVRSPRPVGAPLLWWQKELFYRVQLEVMEDPGIGDMAEHLSYLKSLGFGVLVLEGLNLTENRQNVSTVFQFQQLLTESHKADEEGVGFLCKYSAAIIVVLTLFHLLFLPSVLVCLPPLPEDFSFACLLYCPFRRVFYHCHAVPLCPHTKALPSPLPSHASLSAHAPHSPALLHLQPLLSCLKVLLDLCELATNNGTEGLTAYIQHWLKEGVSGFGICDTDPAYSEETMTEWRTLFQEFSTKDDERILMLRQTRDTLSALNVSSPLPDLVTKALLPSSGDLLSAQEVASAVVTVLQSPLPGWPSWTLGGEVSIELRRTVIFLLMTMPGTPVIEDEDLSIFQNDSADSGSRMSLEEHSEMALLKSLTSCRSREEALLFGSLMPLPFNGTHSNVSSTPSPSSPPPLAFLRSWGCVHFLVVLNLGSESRFLNPDWLLAIPTSGIFVASTEMGRMGSISLETLRLEPQEAVVIKLFETERFSA
ncbi:uncharacterized protein LOC114769610 [Denticeps clupeoides]|uniref:uncharacterized protein LOC114769610 n=1 Tax=Denticeps clupeoides TaxID=299321 RepID=UPI0010A54E42|nr:uncharacterized protein LOC114769610 [Denticeps clupeoides]